MNRKLFALIILGIIPVIVLPIYAADPSEKFTFQGVLKDSAGDLVTATKDITLDFYTASSGGTLRFSNLCNDTSVSSGLFTCTITNPYDNFFAQALFVEVKVADSDGANSETLTPRIELVGAPYSISSLKAGNDFDFLEKGIRNATSINATAIEVGQTGTALAFNVTNTGSGNSFAVYDTGSDTTPFVINNGGNTGIGEPSPANRLHVKDSPSTDAVARFENTNPANFADGIEILLKNSPTIENCFIKLEDQGSNVLGRICGDGAGGILINSTAALRIGFGGEDSGDDFIVDDGDSTFVVESDNNRVGIGISSPASELHVGGTTPIVTIGDADEEDSQITFDGNAADFYIGSDDSHDRLMIGLGSAVGTNPMITLGSGGDITLTSDGDDVIIPQVGAAIELSIGDGEAFDSQITFDGNAQDYYIGLDDTADDLVIGVGTAAGTNVAFTMDSSQRVGIGEIDPAKKLHVVDAITSGTLVRFDNSDTGANGDVLSLQSSVATPGLGNCYINFEDSGAGTDGDICGDGAGGLLISSAVDLILRSIGDDILIPQEGADLKIKIGDGEAFDSQITFDGDVQDYYIGSDTSTDEFKIGRGSVVGTSTAITITSADDIELTPIGDDVRISQEGTDLKVTIGDGEEFDSQITFDGNAQDYYIGLDDTADDLLIGLGSAVGTTAAISIDENQNVGIGNTPDSNLKLKVTGSKAADVMALLINSDTGTTSDGLELQLFGSSGSSNTGNCFLTFSDVGGDIGTICGNGDDGTTISATKGINMTLGGDSTSDFTVDGRTFTVDSENDRVGIGTTNPDYTLQVVNSAPSEPTLWVENQDAGGNTGVGMIIKLGDTTPSTADTYIQFRGGADGVMGSILGTGSATVNYYTGSDERLKENIVNTVYSIDDLMNIQVRDYNFIGANITSTGFIAQELYQVYPHPVGVGGDDPKTNPWGVDYGKLTPLLVKAIQDQQSEIEQLKQIVCTDHPEDEICQ